jgi:hypothetical protein
MESPLMEQRPPPLIRRAAATTAEALFAALVQPERTALVLLFCSPQRAGEELAAELRRRFAPAPVVGCTTAGEITPFGTGQGGISAVSFAAPAFQAVCRFIPDVRDFSVADGRDLVRGALRELEDRPPARPLEQVFAMLLIDGLATCEEAVVSALHRELGPIPLFGGSAGDALDFRATKVLWDGAFHQHGAVSSRPIISPAAAKRWWSPPPIRRGASSPKSTPNRPRGNMPGWSAWRGRR